MSRRNDCYGCYSDWEYEMILEMLHESHKRDECASDCLWCEAERECATD